MDLIQSYKQILISLGLKVDDLGLVSTKVGEDVHGDPEWTPTTVNGKRLVLPTADVLANPDWESTIAFHPLSEKIMRGESTIIKALRLFITARLTSVVIALMEDLMSLAVNSDRHKSLKPAQLKALRGAPDATPKTLERLQKVLERVSVVGDNRILNIFLKRGGELAGKRYNRVAVVSFPIAEHLYEDGEPKVYKELFGVSGINAVDCRSITGLLSYILSDLESPHVYSSGSQDTDAPYFHSLMLSYIKVATQLNNVTSLMASAITKPEDLLIDVSWGDMLDDFGQFKGRVPPLEGNEGEMSEDTTSAKRAGSNLMASTASARVSSGVTGGGDSERVPYVSPTGTPTRATNASLAAAVAVDPNAPKTSSWAKASQRLHGNNPPAVIARNAPQAGTVLIGYDQAGLPVYGPPQQPAPIQQGPEIVTINGVDGYPVQGTFDTYGNFIPLPAAPQGRFQPNMGYGQPLQQPRYQPQTHQQYGGYPQHRQPQQLSGRQASNMRRAGVGFNTTR